LIQDFGICEDPKLKEGESRTGPNRKTDCRLNWGYYVVNSITDLAPRFLMAYSSGALSLSVLADDIEGASRIYIKGLLNIRHDWDLWYRAGAHFLNETNEDKFAAYALNQAVTLGAPHWIAALSAKIYSESGRAVLGCRNLISFIRANKRVTRDDHLNSIGRVKKRLAELYQKVKKEDPANAFECLFDEAGNKSE
jgi:hypothetical protein